MRIIDPQWKWKNNLATRPYTKYVVLHHAAAVACGPYEVDTWHKANGWSGIGYHFFIRKDGSVFRGRPIWAIGAHAEGKNSESIGICAEGNYETEYIMPEAQKNAIKEVLRIVKLAYPEAGIKAHRQVGATGCPGKYYPMAEMMDYFNNIIKNESEEICLTQYEELKREIDKLKIKTGYYNYIDSNMNEAYKPTVIKLVKSGKLQGNEKGELMLTNDMMRILTILDRAGVLG